MASSLLRSISDFLETGIDDCVNQLYDIQSAELSPELEKSPSFNTYSPEILLRRNHKLRYEQTPLMLILLWFCYTYIFW